MKAKLFGTLALLMLPTIAFAADAGSGPATGATSTNDAGSGPTKGAKPDNNTTEMKGMGAPGAEADTMSPPSRDRAKPADVGSEEGSKTKPEKTP